MLQIAFLVLVSVTLFGQVARSQMRIVIDAGHGGKDPGKEGSPSKNDEKHLNLSIALQVGERIKREFPAAKIFYTRASDTFLSLEERANFANRLKADFFVSIHCNSNKSSEVAGAKTHIHSKNNKDAHMLATLVQHSLETNAKRVNRGVQDSRERGENLFVLQYTNMPSILVETGFLTNPEEENYINSAFGQQMLADAIFRGISRYVLYKHPQIAPTPTYKVQIIATRNRMKLDSPQFQQLGMHVEEIKVIQNNQTLYKYLVGTEKSTVQAQLIQQKVRKKGFDDAFIVQTR